MSAIYVTAKRMYNKGLWTNRQIASLVEAGKLTSDEYESITGEPYETEAS